MTNYIQNVKGFVNELHMPHHQARRAIDMLHQLKSRLSSLDSLNQLIDFMKSMLSHSHEEGMTPGFEME